MFRKFIKTQFFRHASILQIGSLAQFGVSFIGSVLIARLLGPEQYGIYALAVALAGIFGLFLDWGQGAGSLILFSKAHAEGNQEEMQRVGAFYLKTTLRLYILIGIPLALVAGYAGTALYHRTDLGNYVRWLVLGGFLAAGPGLVTMLLQVVRRIWLLTFIEGIDQIFKTGGMLIGLFWGFGITGVVGGQVAGVTLSSLLAWHLYRYTAQSGMLPRFRMFVRHMRDSSRAYLRFSFPIALDKNVSELYTVGTMALLGWLTAPSEVGFFKIALSYMSLALFVLGPVARLIQDQFPKDQIRDTALLKNHFIKVSLLSGAVSLIAGTILLLLGPFLVRLVYGEVYAEMIPFIHAFWWYTAIVGFGVGLGSLYRTLDKVAFTVKLNLLTMTFGFPMLWYATERFGALGAIYSFALMRVVSHLIAFFRAMKYLKSIKTIPL